MTISPRLEGTGTVLLWQPHLGRREQELFYLFHCDHLTLGRGNRNCSIYTIVNTSLGYEETGSVQSIPLWPPHLGRKNCSLYTIVTISPRLEGTGTVLLWQPHLGRREQELFYLFHCDHLTLGRGNWNCSIYTIVNTSLGYEETGSVQSIPMWPSHLGRREPELVSVYQCDPLTSREGTGAVLSISLWPPPLGRRELELFYLYYCDYLTRVKGNWNCSVYTTVATSLKERNGTVLSIPLRPPHVGRRELELFYLYHCDTIPLVGWTWDCFIYIIVTASVG